MEVFVDKYSALLQLERTGIISFLMRGRSNESGSYPMFMQYSLKKSNCKEALEGKFKVYVTEASASTGKQSLVQACSLEQESCLGILLTGSRQLLGPIICNPDPQTIVSEKLANTSLQFSPQFSNSSRSKLNTIIMAISTTTVKMVTPMIILFFFRIEKIINLLLATQDDVSLDGIVCGWYTFLGGCITRAARAINEADSLLDLISVPLKPEQNLH